MIQLAVILDMDGLMVDSEPLSRRAWDQVLAHYGHVLNDDVYSAIIGHRTDESAALLKETYNLPLTIEAFAREKGDALAKIRAGGVPAMPGLYDLHRCIIEHGLSWGVATSSPLRHALELLDQLGLGNSCQTVAGGDEVVNGKPAPDIYLLAAKRLGLRPAQCLAVEDSAPGCQAALSAGFMVVAVPNRDTKASDFSTVDYTFSSLLEVVERFEDLLVELAKR